MDIYTSDSKYLNPKKLKPGIYLISDNWDDYLFRTSFIMHYIDKNKNLMEIGPLRIANIVESENVKKMEGYKTSLPSSLTSENLMNYISLGSVDYYENIKEYLAKDEREGVFKKLNDIAFNLELFNTYKDKDVVKTSFLRESNLYTVKNQLNRIANGGAMLTDYDFDVYLESATLNFTVSPESLLPTNVHALIGNNGTGKSHIMRSIVKNYNELLKIKSEEDFDSLVKEEEGVFESILYLSFSPFDDISELYDLKEEMEEKLRVVSLLSKSRNVSKINKLMEELKSNIEEIMGSKNKKDDWETILDELSFDREIKKMKNQLFSKDQSSVKYEKLSSGQKILLISLSSIILNIQEKTLILIDEPETYLHPPLVAAYIRIITNISLKYNGVSILATHSPIVIQEIQKDCIYITTREEEGTLKVKRPKHQTFGENIGALTDEVFGIELRSSGFYNFLEKLVYDEKPKAEQILEDDLLGIETSGHLRILLRGTRDD